jgi:hypothetical protein
MSTVIEQRPRRRNPASRLVTVPVSLALIVATTVLGSWMITHKPGSQSMARPFFYSGHVGEVISHPTFTVEVLGVRGGSKVLDTRDENFTTEGAFVLVEVRIVANQQGVKLAAIVAVDADGRQFEAAARLTQGITEGYRFEPGIPVEADIAFEIPAEAGPGLKMWLGTSEILDRHTFQNLAEVDLGIDQEAVDRWRAERRTVEMKLPIFAR